MSEFICVKAEFKLERSLVDSSQRTGIFKFQYAIHLDWGFYQGYFVQLLTDN